MKIIPRSIQSQIEKMLHKGKIIILYGPRQVGKTTLVKEIIRYEPNSLYATCDDPQIREKLQNKGSHDLELFAKGKKLLVIDEAQQVKNIGLTLKLLHDTFTELQIIATGSSSFELANQIQEPLTGRAFTYLLLPLSLEELKNNFDQLTVDQYIQTCLIYGSYPEVLLGNLDRQQLLTTIASQYLYKDILMFEGIRKPDLLDKLLKVLAASVGSEVSYYELSNTLGVTRPTIEKYITYLEQAFIVFRVPPLFPNTRSQVTKKQKIYFYDVGMRNAILGNFHPLNLRSDVGALWENFAIVERKKIALARNLSVKQYFWRSYTGAEVDLVEEWPGPKKFAFEMKYKEKKRNAPALWQQENPEIPIDYITRNNYRTLLGF